MSCSPTLCRATKEQVFLDPGGLQALLAHLLAIRSQLDTMANSQAQMYDVVHTLQQDGGLHARPVAMSPHPLPSDGASRGPSPRFESPRHSGHVFADDMVKADLDLEKELEGVESKYQTRKSVAQDGASKRKEREMLLDLTKKAEREEAQAFAYRRMSLWQKARAMTPAQKEAVLDATTGVLVVANAVVIGLSADETEVWQGWQWVDVCFAVGFFCEMIVKMVLQGFFDYFRQRANWLDFCLVAFDAVQIALWIANSVVVGQAYALVRVVRLARLSRISRVLRLTFSQDLVRMTSGISGSLPSLLWSVVLVLLSVYVMALVFRETVGRSDTEYELTGKYFSSVPRSTLTLFRCAFGDCSTSGGSPIFEHVTEFHSAWLAVLYGVFLYFVAIGLFNVISAIFVESTMMAATEGEKAAKAQRLADEKLWVTRIATLLRVIMQHADPDWDRYGRLSENIDSILSISLSRQEFDEVVQDEAAAKALDDLDICREDHAYLSNILDPDNSEVVSVTEIVQGIESLRGEPRRSDIVAVDLMVRSVQLNLNSMSEQLTGLKERSSDVLKLITSLVKSEVSHNRHQFDLG